MICFIILFMALNRTISDFLSGAPKETPSERWPLISPEAGLINRRRAAFIFFLTAVFWACSSIAAESPALQVGTDDYYSLTTYFNYIEDPSGKLTADELLRPGGGNIFRPITGPKVNFGYSHSVFWLKAVLSNNSPADKRLFLEIAYPTLDNVTVCLVGPDGNRQVAETGDLQPFSLRPYPHHNLIFPLKLPMGFSTLLIRVKSEGSLTVPSTLWNIESFHHYSNDSYAIHSLYFGLLAALLLYNFMLFLSLREPVYLAYVGFVAWMAVGQMSMIGLGNEFLWPNFPAWGNAAFSSGFAATGFFGALFARLFLDTKRNAPRLDQLILLSACGFAVSGLGPAFMPYQWTAILTSLFGVIFSAVAVTAGVVCLFRGHPGARYFLLAWTMLLAGVAMLGMRNFGWLPTTFVTTYGMQIGSALEMLLLSFALADRINHMRREKEQMQQQALRVSQEAEWELASKTREWEETFNSISDMVIILDRQHTILKANSAVATFLKTAPEALVNNKCYVFHHEDGRPFDKCPCRTTFESKKSATVEFYEPRFERYLEVSTSPILNNAGEVTAVVHITKDITWRKKMEGEMLKAEKLESLAVLSGGISHDFNNMLTVIMSTVTLAKMYADNNPVAVSKLEEAEKEIMHARELTNQLLTFAKGGAPVRRLSTFQELLRDTVEFNMKGSDAECSLAIADDLWPAEIDRVQISQVISNMIINAKQAMPLGGSLSVSAANTAIDESAGLPISPGRYVRITFEDNGAGITPEHLSKIFDPFFTTKSEGSGLGLSTSYSIVKKHNGCIKVKSSVGAGSVFDIYLPASSDAFVDEAARPCVELKGTGRVLLMDDDEKLLNNVGEMLGVLGYEVEAARNGEEAIILYKRALALKRPFDAVVMDLTIVGGMGGRDCMEEIMKLAPGVKAIVISGYADNSVLAEHGRYGFKEALSKPFSIEELHRALWKVMTGADNGDA